MYSVRHVGITVKNIEKSLKLYKNYFGFQIIWDKIEKGKFIDGLSGLNNVIVRTVKLKDKKENIVELLQYKSHQKNNSLSINNRKINQISISHFAINVENLDDTYIELSKIGIKFNAKPAFSPDGGVKVCFCKDFDGNLIELVEEIN